MPNQTSITEKNTWFPDNNIIEDDIKLILKELEVSISQLEGKKILITGASGMLASYLVYTLLYANTHIFQKPAKLYLVIRRGRKPFGKNQNIHYLDIDITKQSPREKGFHYIVHAASKAAPKLYMKEMIDTLNSNILGLYNILKICDKNLESLLYISSGEVYGTPKNSKPIDETYIGMIDHLNKRSCYVEGKRACETICMNYFWEKKVPIKIARLFHTFGPGLNLNDGRVFSDFIKFGLDGKDITILGDKDIKRPFLYISDATIMLLKLFLSNQNGQIFNVANEKNIISVKKFAQIICNHFNQKYDKKINVVIDNKKTISYYKHAIKTIRPNIDKFKKFFSYEPKTGVAKAVKKTIDYYLSFKQ